MVVFHNKPYQENKNDDNHQNPCRSPRYTLILLLLLIALEMGVLRGLTLLFPFLCHGDIWFGFVSSFAKIMIISFQQIVLGDFQNPGLIAVKG